MNQALPLEKTPENLKTCQICGKVYENLRFTMVHIINTHKIARLVYLQQFFIQDNDNQYCIKCGIKKSNNEFYYRKEKGEYRTECRECHLKQKHQYGTRPSVQLSKRTYNREYTQKEFNKEKQRCRGRIRRSTPNGRIRTIYSNKVNKFLKIFNIKKIHTNIDFMGCTIDEFRKYIESQFTEGMTWDNHGFGDDKWHFDHIIPCSFFNLKDYTEFKFCFHYTNYQPLWQKDNLSKNDSLTWKKD